MRTVLLFILLCMLLLQQGFLYRQASFSPRTQISPAQALSAGEISTPVGITIELDATLPQGQASRLRELEAGGLQWVRVQMSWARLEPSPGQFDWEAADAFFSQLDATSLFAIVVLDDSPDWARRADEQSAHFPGRAPPIDLADFARFAQAFAQRYAVSSLTHTGPHTGPPTWTEPGLDPVPRTYEIWHEPNIAPNWGNRHIDPIGYAYMVRHVAEAIRAVDPHARILSGALAPTNDRGHLAQDELHFLSRFLAAGGGVPLDGIAVQPFGFGRTPFARSPTPQQMGFDRLLYLRRGLEDMGGGHLPLWAMGFGWNRSPNGIWQAVSPSRQLEFTASAVSQARRLPWLAGLGWPVDAPSSHTPPADPVRGFALTPSLLDALTNPDRDPTMVASHPLPPGPTPWAWLVHFGLLGLCCVWGVVAARQTKQYLGPYLRPFIPAHAHLLFIWLPLAALYHLATWPPLILFCWLVAMVLIWRRPHHGLYGAALLLPFHFQHKDLSLVDLHLSIPPAHPFIAGLCLRLGFDTLAHIWTSFRLSNRLVMWPKHAGRALFMSASWVLLSLWANANAGLLFPAEAANLRNVPGAMLGLWEWTIIPLVLFWAIARYLDAQQRHKLIVFLGAGGTLVALIGLLQWSRGQGVWADGTLRLAGLYFSPNHTALYLVRTLFICLALLVAARHRHSRLDSRDYSQVNSDRYAFGWALPLTTWLWASSCAAIAVALWLTGSRGAWLLGVPTGAWVFFFLLHQAKLDPSRETGQSTGSWVKWAGLLLLGVATGTGLAYWGGLIALDSGLERLRNAESVIERIHIWQGAWWLWLDHPWTGTGPAGFYWRFPAYLPLDATFWPVVDANLRHPHNVWLEWLTTWGILGLCWFLAAGALLLGKVFIAASRPAPILYAGLAAGLLAGFAHAQVDAFWALADLAAWNGLAAGLLWQIEIKNR